MSVFRAVLGCVGAGSLGGSCQSPQGAYCLVSKISLAHKGVKGKHFLESTEHYQNTLPASRSLWNVQLLLGIQTVPGCCSGPTGEVLRTARVSVSEGRCLVKCPFLFQGNRNQHLTMGSCPLPGSLFWRDWAGWPPLWRRKGGRSQGGKGVREHLGTSDSTLPPRRMNSMLNDLSLLRILSRLCPSHI